MGRFGGRKCRLLTMLCLTAAFFFVEIVVGYITNSMSLIADSFHMLSDVVALIIAFMSVKMSPKKWSKNTFGWARAEVLGALINAVFLVALCLSITIEAFKRFIEPENIKNPRLLVTVGVIGLLVNVIGLFLFHEHGHSHVVKANRNPLTHLVPSPTGEATTDVGSGTTVTNVNASGSGNVAVGIEEQSTSNTVFHHTTSGKKQKQKHSHHHHHGHGHSHGHSHAENDRSYQMNMRGVFLHVLSDALGSVIVICSAIVFWTTQWKYRLYIDPALSIVLVMLILQSVWPLLRDSALILLQTVPTHIQVDAIEQRLLAKVDGVIGVHEFHVWQLAGDRIIASAHIRCRNLSEYMKIAEQVKEFFHNEGIHSTTMQPEFIEDLPGVDDSMAAVGSSDDNQHLLDPSELSSERLQRQLQQRHLQQSTEDCVLDCPKTQNSCVQSTCCGPSKQERDNFVMPIIVDNCRQRTNSTQNGQDSENGALLSYGNYSKQTKNQNRNSESHMASSSRSNDV